MRTPMFLQPTVRWASTISLNMSVREKALMGILVLILFTSAVFSIVGYVKRNSYLIPQSGGTYSEGAVGQPRHVNPVLASANDTDSDISSVIFSSLFEINDKFELTPDLATGHTISPDGKVYTVQLRQGVTWHDGHPFTADDVVFTIRSIQTPDYGSPLHNSFQGVQVDKVDDFTVRFTLKEPYAPFLTNLTVGIIPKHVWESIPPKNATLAEQMLKPVGTGPFKFSQIATRRKTGEITSIDLARNDSYYGERPYIDKVSFVFFQTHEEALDALKAGNIDGVGFLPISHIDSIDARPSLQVQRLLLPQYIGLFFNEVKNDVLSDAGVRAALSLSTDRQHIVDDALHGQAEPLHVPIPPRIFSVGDNSIQSTYNPDTARQNLEDAGWKDADGNGVREKDGKELRLKITTTDWPEFIRTAELIKEQWEKIGVAVDIESYGAGVIQQTIVGPREYEVLLYGEILAADPDPYPFWHSTQTRSPGLNLSLFKDKDVDKLLEEARKTSDTAARLEKYQQFQQRFSDLNPAIILYQPYYLFAQKDKVRGFELDKGNLPSARFTTIEKWHVKVKRIWNNS